MSPRFLKSSEIIVRDIKKAFIQIGIFTACITALCIALPHALSGVVAAANLIF